LIESSIAICLLLNGFYIASAMMASIHQHSIQAARKKRAKDHQLVRYSEQPAKSPRFRSSSMKKVKY
jgi:hypothetical protein